MRNIYQLNCLQFADPAPTSQLLSSDSDQAQMQRLVDVIQEQLLYSDLCPNDDTVRLAGLDAPLLRHPDADSYLQLQVSRGSKELCHVLVPCAVVREHFPSLVAEGHFLAEPCRQAEQLLLTPPDDRPMLFPGKFPGTEPAPAPYLGFGVSVKRVYSGEIFKEGETFKLFPDRHGHAAPRTAKGPFGKDAISEHDPQIKSATQIECDLHVGKQKIVVVKIDCKKGSFKIETPMFGKKVLPVSGNLADLTCDTRAAPYLQALRESVMQMTGCDVSQIRVKEIAIEGLKGSADFNFNSEVVGGGYNIQVCALSCTLEGPGVEITGKCKLGCGQSRKVATTKVGKGGTAIENQFSAAWWELNIKTLNYEVPFSPIPIPTPDFTASASDEPVIPSARHDPLAISDPIDLTKIDRRVPPEMPQVTGPDGMIGLPIAAVSAPVTFAPDVGDFLSSADKLLIQEMVLKIGAHIKPGLPAMVFSASDALQDFELHAELLGVVQTEPNISTPQSSSLRDEPETATTTQSASRDSSLPDALLPAGASADMVDAAVTSLMQAVAPHGAAAAMHDRDRSPDLVAVLDMPARPAAAAVVLSDMPATQANRVIPKKFSTSGRGAESGLQLTKPSDPFDEFLSTWALPIGEHQTLSGAVAVNDKNISGAITVTHQGASTTAMTAEMSSQQKSLTVTQQSQTENGSVITKGVKIVAKGGVLYWACSGSVEIPVAFTAAGLATGAAVIVGGGLVWFAGKKLVNYYKKSQIQPLSWLPQNNDGLAFTHTLLDLDNACGNTQDTNYSTLLKQSKMQIVQLARTYASNAKLCEKLKVISYELDQNDTTHLHDGWLQTKFDDSKANYCAARDPLIAKARRLYQDGRVQESQELIKKIQQQFTFESAETIIPSHFFKAESLHARSLVALQKNNVSLAQRLHNEALRTATDAQNKQDFEREFAREKFVQFKNTLAEKTDAQIRREISDRLKKWPALPLRRQEADNASLESSAKIQQGTTATADGMGVDAAVKQVGLEGEQQEQREQQSCIAHEAVQDVTYPAAQTPDQPAEPFLDQCISAVQQEAAQSSQSQQLVPTLDCREQVDLWIADSTLTRDEVLSKVEKLCATDAPNDADLQYMACQIAQDLQRAPQSYIGKNAREFFSKIIERNPKNCFAHWGLSLAYDANGEWFHALSVLVEAKENFLASDRKNIRICEQFIAQQVIKLYERGAFFCDAGKLLLELIQYIDSEFLNNYFSNKLKRAQRFLAEVFSAGSQIQKWLATELTLKMMHIPASEKAKTFGIFKGKGAVLQLSHVLRLLVLSDYLLNKMGCAYLDQEARDMLQQIVTGCDATLLSVEFLHATYLLAIAETPEAVALATVSFYNAGAGFGLFLCSWGHGYFGDRRARGMAPVDFPGILAENICWSLGNPISRTVLFIAMHADQIAAFSTALAPFATGMALVFPGLAALVAAHVAAAKAVVGVGVAIVKGGILIFQTNPVLLIPAAIVGKILYDNQKYNSMIHNVDLKLKSGSMTLEELSNYQKNLDSLIKTWEEDKKPTYQDGSAWYYRQLVLAQLAAKHSETTFAEIEKNLSNSACRVAGSFRDALQAKAVFMLTEIEKSLSTCKQHLDQKGNDLNFLKIKLSALREFHNLRVACAKANFTLDEGLKTQRARELQETFQLVLKLDPSDYISRAYYAASLFSQGKPDEALGQYGYAIASVDDKLGELVQNGYKDGEGYQSYQKIRALLATEMEKIHETRREIFQSQENELLYMWNRLQRDTQGILQALWHEPPLEAIPAAGTGEEHADDKSVQVQMGFINRMTARYRIESEFFADGGDLSAACKKILESVLEPDENSDTETFYFVGMQQMLDNLEPVYDKFEFLQYHHMRRAGRVVVSYVEDIRQLSDALQELQATQTNIELLQELLRKPFPHTEFLTEKDALSLKQHAKKMLEFSIKNQIGCVIQKAQETYQQMDEALDKIGVFQKNTRKFEADLLQLSMVLHGTQMVTELSGRFLNVFTKMRIHQRQVALQKASIAAPSWDHALRQRTQKIGREPRIPGSSKLSDQRHGGAVSRVPAGQSLLFASQYRGQTTTILSSTKKKSMDLAKKPMHQANLWSSGRVGRQEEKGFVLRVTK